MAILHAPAPTTVMLQPNHDRSLYAPEPVDEHAVVSAARRVAERVLACATASSAQEQADEAAALVAGWKAWVHAHA